MDFRFIGLGFLIAAGVLIGQDHLSLAGKVKTLEAQLQEAEHRLELCTVREETRNQHLSY